MAGNATRDLELFVLEAASAAEDEADDFFVLLDNLGLPPCYRERLVHTVKAGRWRLKEYPMQALRRAVQRASLRQEETGKNRREVSGFNGAQLDVAASETELDDPDWELRKEFPLIERWLPESLRESTSVPEDLQEWFVDPLVRPAWKRICSMALLDEWETKALIYMVDGTTRYRALKETDTEEDKRALEAAWKRVERNGLERVRTILQPIRADHEARVRDEYWLAITESIGPKSTP